MTPGLSAGLLQCIAPRPLRATERLLYPNIVFHARRYLQVGEVSAEGKEAARCLIGALLTTGFL